MVLTLGSTNATIFAETIGILSSENILEDDVYLKVVFSIEAVQNLI
jgi:hypothetical protein